MARFSDEMNFARPDRAKRLTLWILQSLPSDGASNGAAVNLPVLLGLGEPGSGPSSSNDG